MARSKHHRADQPDSEWRRKRNLLKYNKHLPTLDAQQAQAVEDREARKKASAKYVEEQVRKAEATKKKGFFSRLFRRVAK